MLDEVFLSMLLESSRHQRPLYRLDGEIDGLHGRCKVGRWVISPHCSMRVETLAEDQVAIVYARRPLTPCPMIAKARGYWRMRVRMDGPPGFEADSMKGERGHRSRQLPIENRVSVDKVVCGRWIASTEGRCAVGYEVVQRYS